MIAAAVIISLLYVFTMLFLLYGFSNLSHFCGKNMASECTFSIIIPLRNEAENLPSLFESLLKLKYPEEQFEILLINDSSTDASEALCEEFRRKYPELNIQLLQNIRKSGSPKKDAILTAIEVATKDFILTTDADCVVPEKWLREFDAIIREKELQVVAGPVMLKNGVPKMAFLRSFEEMDMLSLQAATIGSFGLGIPLLCNGANFCYSKKAFFEVNGFEGNDQIGSGDDIFLLEKYQKRGLKTAFLKSAEAIVLTKPASSWKQLFSQRVRWAAKTSRYKNPFAKALGVLVFGMNFMLLIVFAGVLSGLSPLSLLLVVFLAKFNVDFFLIYNTAKFYGRKSSVKSYFLSSIFYPFFSSSVAMFSLFSGYEWKGRRFKK
ncbi:glycosyltransferase family 2 protein [Salinimicrobium xinjiangense]|uniref:glycosyltransferase family 2 protein n=1 Tax=Salinimicrobium xinjiangense TaxID=438596 RepID=UPI0004019B02|nr:glycosyltransferase [Salinimicrobium xinjiangense]